MDIENLTIKQVREVSAICGGGHAQQRVPFEPGKAYLFRAVTYAKIGRVRDVVGDFVVLDDASWVQDTGRYGHALATGELAELERVPDGGGVALGAIVDWDVWLHPLPLETK